MGTSSAWRVGLIWATAITASVVVLTVPIGPGESGTSTTSSPAPAVTSHTGSTGTPVTVPVTPASPRATAASAAPPRPAPSSSPVMPGSTEQEPAPGSASWSFHHADRSGDPISWTKCELRLAVNVSKLPRRQRAYAERVVRATADALSAHSGFTFVNAGRSTLVPFHDDQWWTRMDDVDIVVAFETERDMPRLNALIGLGGPVTGADGTRVTAGGVTIPARFAPRPGARHRDVLLHQFGHVLGLGHPAAPDQVMSAGGPALRPTRLQDGDKRGLAALGAASGCRTDGRQDRGN